MAAIASSTHGLRSRSSTKASQVGHITIQPTAAHVDGDGRHFLVSHMGAIAIHSTAAMMKPVMAIAAKLAESHPREASHRNAPSAAEAARYAACAVPVSPLMRDHSQQPMSAMVSTNAAHRPRGAKNTMPTRSKKM